MNIFVNKDFDTKVMTIFEDESYNYEVLDFAIKKNLFKSSLGEIYADCGFNSTNTVFLGLGKKDKLNDEKLRIAAFKLGNHLNNLKIESASIKLPNIENLNLSKSFAEGLLHSTYHFDKFLSKKHEVYLKDINIENGNEKEIDEAKILIDGIFLSRELVDEPAMYLYPETLANIATTKLTEVGVEVEVFDKDKIEEIGMSAYMAVAQGSDKEPKFIIMKYVGNPDSDKSIAFVGKGLTYDSGGYNLKPGNSMLTMHCDMGGSATVIGAIYSIAKAKLKTNVYAVVASCENLISGHAYKPGDIINSLSGKTIFVGNTDAEGRLTLADALYYTADVIKPNAIIDFATLTGACVVALGEIYTGAITNNEELYKKIEKAGKESGERMWLLPVDDDYRELIKSKVADVSNIGVRGAGCITAGLFLENFVKDIPWVHMDIAGTAYLSSPVGYLPAGATGIHVKTLFNLVKNNEF